MLERTCEQVNISTVAIIDDNKDDVELEELWIEDAGKESVYLKGPFKSVDELIKLVKEVGADSAICDHRLGRGYATFDGAQAVAALYKENIPAILVTTFIDMDINTSIRKWRQNIPALLSRDEGDEDTVCKAFLTTIEEIKGNVPEFRRPHRTLIRIQGVTTEEGNDVIDAIIPQWNPIKAVRFPRDLIEPSLRNHVNIGAWYIAHVNTGAIASADLFFSDLELAPEPAKDV